MGECVVNRGYGSSGSSLPSGAIVLWSGAANAIPDGWYLCNGSNGTPDLRGRFIVGAGGTYAVGNTGGAASVALTVNQIPAHTHGIKYTNVQALGTSSTSTRASYFGGSNYSTATESAGGGQSHENRPPYYALCYIMKA